MIIAFLLIVIVEGENISDDRMLFRNIERCIYFAQALERSDYRRRTDYNKNVDAYCIPKMVPRGTELFE